MEHKRSRRHATGMNVQRQPVRAETAKGKTEVRQGTRARCEEQDRTRGRGARGSQRAQKDTVEENGRQATYGDEEKRWQIYNLGEPSRQSLRRFRHAFSWDAARSDRLIQPFELPEAILGRTPKEDICGRGHRIILGQPWQSNFPIVLF